MSRQIDFDKPLSEEEVLYLQDRDDSRLASAILPDGVDVDTNPDVRGTINETGLDEIRPDEAEAEDEGDKPEAEAKTEEKPAPKKR